MNVLSLFDGLSCGQIALNRANIPYDNYYASEIDSVAMAVTMSNYPNTIQLGDVIKLNGHTLPQIDLLIGGSPCQGFSVAGKMLNFDDPRSKLFFEFVRLLKETKPKYFLLENVKMKKEWQNIISEFVGVEPIEINSSLTSAQNRRRLYWTNIPNVTQPDDKNINLVDILDPDIDDKKIVFDANGKCEFPAYNGKIIRLNSSVNPPYTIYESRTEFGKAERKRLRKLLGRDTTPRNKEHKEYLPLKTNKANCILTSESILDYFVDTNYNFRTYTIAELERLQNIPNGYMTKIGLNKNKIRKMIGNGWTVDVITNIFKQIDCGK